MLNKNPIKVSIMVLAYNHEKYIRKALDSIVMQKTNFRFEAVIGEDKSTDNTREIIREYQRKYPEIIKPIFRRKNLGACKNVVSTLHECKGEYIAFMECDDFWSDPLKLQKQADYLDSHPSCSSVMCRTTVVNRYDKPMVTGPKVLDYEVKNPFEYAKTMYPYNQFKFDGALMTRNYYADGKYDCYLLQTEYVSDIIVQGIAILHGKMGFMDDNMAVYRFVPSNGNNFSSLDKGVLCRDKIKASRILMMLFPKKTYFRIHMRICREHWILIYGFKNAGKYFKLIQYIWKEMTICDKLFFGIYWIRRKTTGEF